MNRFLSLLLAISMVLSYVPTPAMAQGTEPAAASGTLVQSEKAPVVPEAKEPANADPAAPEEKGPANADPAGSGTAAPAGNDNNQPAASDPKQSAASGTTAPAENNTDKSAGTENNLPADPAAVQVHFVCQPAEVQLTVYTVSGDVKTEIKPDEAGLYELQPGDYFYDAVLEGYVSQEAEPFTVKDQAQQDVLVTLQKVQTPAPDADSSANSTPNAEPSVNPTPAVETVTQPWHFDEFSAMLARTGFGIPYVESERPLTLESVIAKLPRCILWNKDKDESGSFETRVQIADWTTYNYTDDGNGYPQTGTFWFSPQLEEGYAFPNPVSVQVELYAKPEIITSYDYRDHGLSITPQGAYYLPYEEGRALDMYTLENTYLPKSILWYKNVDGVVQEVNVQIMYWTSDDYAEGQYGEFNFHPHLDPEHVFENGDTWISVYLEPDPNANNVIHTWQWGESYHGTLAGDVFTLNYETEYMPYTPEILCNQLLPDAILINGGADSYVGIDRWSYPDYQPLEDGTYPQTGSFVFEATPDLSVTLDPSAKPLKLTVVLPEKPDGIEINEVNFPDPNFQQMLGWSADQNHDNFLTQEELDSVTQFYANSEIQDYTGISYFKNLTSFQAYEGIFTNLDLSGNPNLLSVEIHDTPLLVLNVAGCSKLQTLNVTSAKLSTLDLSSCPRLETVNLYSNNLSSLNLSGCSSLRTLDASSNRLADLDLGSCPNLETISLRENQLSAIDVSGCKNLKGLSLENNHITELNVSGNTQLESLWLWSNQLTRLDLSKNVNLRGLNCSTNRLTSLDLSHNKKLRKKWDNGYPADQGDNLYTAETPDGKLNLAKLPGFNVSRLIKSSLKNGKLQGTVLIPDSPDVPVMYSYDCGNSTKLHVQVIVTKTGGQGVALDQNNFPDQEFRAYLAKHYDLNKNGALENAEIAHIKSLTYTGGGIQSLKGIEYLSALANLDVHGNAILELDLSSNPLISYLNCADNQLHSLDVSQNSGMYALLCENNQLHSLKLGNSAGLQFINCNNNQIEMLDLSKQKGLEDLNAENNQLTALDTSNSPKLRNLSCSNNRIGTLDLRKNPSLQQVDCRNNKLTALLLGEKKSLSYLNADENSLTSLDLSQAKTAIHSLNLSFNQITSLDVSNAKKMEYFSCHANGMSSLNLKGCSALQNLYCGGNNFAYLDLNDCKILDEYNTNLGQGMDNVYYVKSQDLTLDLKTIPGFDYRRASNWRGGTVSKDGILTSEADGMAVTYDYECRQGGSQITRGFTIILTTASHVLVDPYFFPDEAFRDYVSNNIDKDYDGMLTEEERNAVDRINLYDYFDSSYHPRNLKGIELFPNLTYLHCNNMGLTSLDLSHNTELINLCCNGNSLRTLDLSKNTKLRGLFCGGNQLQTLDLTANKMLTDLNCSSNQLSDLNLSGFGELRDLNCMNNKLENLVLTGCSKLEILDVAWNNLRSLDTSDSPKLRSLTCSQNPITSLSLENNVGLEELSLVNVDLVCLNLPENMYLSSFRLIGFRECVSTDGTVDMKSLDPSFDPARASGWDNAQMDAEGIVTVLDPAKEVSYIYDCGNGKHGTIFLTLSNPMEWIQVGNHWIYGTSKEDCLRSQFLTYQGETYYLGADGYMVTGWQTVEGSEYFFAEDGTMVKNAWVDGKYLGADGKVDPTKFEPKWIKDGSKWKYQCEDGHFYTSEWAEINGARYCFDENSYRRTGWYEEAGETYYLFSDGKMAVGKTKVGSSYHFFAEDGKMQYGFVEADGKRYYYGDDGKLSKGGWLIYPTVRFYINRDGSAATGKVKIGSSYYLFAVNGEMMTGWQEIDGKRYVFGDDGKMVTSGWLELNGVKYYLNRDGSMAVGKVKIGSRYYLFAESGAMQTGWQNVDYGRRYFDPEQGYMLVNSWIQDGENRYYVNQGGSPVSGLYKVSGKQYVFDGDGVMQTGWIRLSGSKHYFDPVKGYMLVNTWIDNETYYVQRDGRQTVGIYKIGRYTYYFDENGVKRTGEVTVNGERYFLDPETGAAKTGWQTVDGNKYYYGTDGRLHVGVQKIGSSYYGFDENGVLQGEGWFHYDGKTYYLDKYGKAKIGRQTLTDSYGAKHYYYFDKDGGQMLTGVQKIGSYVYVMNEDGHAQADWYTDPATGTEYYLDNYGKAKTGRQYLTGKDGAKHYYYFDTLDGHLLKGVQKIGKYTYCLWPTTGVAWTYWYKDEAGNLYYCDRYGKAATGWKTLPTKEGPSERYYFDENGVRQEGSYETMTVKHIEVKGAHYFLNPGGAAATNCWLNYEGARYYVDSTGKAKTGKVMLQEPNGYAKHYYFFDADGKMAVNEIVTISRRFYGFGADGAMLTGMETVAGKTYNFSRSGYALTGWQTVDGEKRYFDKTTGAMVVNQWQDQYYLRNDGTIDPDQGWVRKGSRYQFKQGEVILMSQWLTLENADYYLDENGYRLTGLKEVEGQNYGFGTDGKMLIGLNKVGSYYYYFNEDPGFGNIGVRRTGRVLVEAKVHDFDETTGRALTGWKKGTDGTKRYYSAEGRLCIGIEKIGSGYYGFDENGVLQGEGWFTWNGDRYYLDRNGRAYTSWRTIQDESGSHRFYFARDGKMETGLLKIGSSYYGFAPDGEILTGWAVFDGYRYYFDTRGKAKTGWQNLDYARYYFDRDGRAVTGVQKIGSRYYGFHTDGSMMRMGEINGEAYLFSEQGYAKPGMNSLSGTTYYVEENGKLHKGWLSYRGEQYYFNDMGGMVTGRVLIDGREYFFDMNGKLI